MNVDFDAVEGGFSVIPSGTYLVRVKKFERKPSKAGNDMVTWTGVVVDGPHMGASLLDFCTITEKAVWKLAKFIKCAGVSANGKMDTDSSGFADMLKACVGQTMYWNVIEASNDGKQVNKVEGYSADSNQPVVVATPDDMDTPEWAREK